MLQPNENQLNTKYHYDYIPPNEIDALIFRPQTPSNIPSIAELPFDTTSVHEYTSLLID